MQAATHTLLTQLVILSGLIGGTIEYAEIIKRRARRGLQVAEGAWYPEGDGLRGLVRVFQAPSRPRWSTLPSRSRLAADLGWALIGLIAMLLIPFALVLQSALRTWRALRPETDRRRGRNEQPDAATHGDGQIALRPASLQRRRSIDRP